MFEVYRDDSKEYIHIIIIVVIGEVEKIIKHIRGDAIIVSHSYHSVRLYPSFIPLSRHPAHLRPLYSW